MFTGIVQAIGVLGVVQSRGEGVEVQIVNVPGTWRVRVGDSVCVDGICLTAEEVRGAEIQFYLSAETLACTTAHNWSTGQSVHLEPALSTGEPLGGHIVQGHVDCVSTTTSVERVGDDLRVGIQVPAEIVDALFPKGSIAVNGVSLTVNQLRDTNMYVNLIPHTLEQTTFDQIQPKQQVNLEADPIAKQVAYILQQRQLEKQQL